MHADTEFFVNIQNRSATSITQASVSYGGRTWQLGAIAPGASVRKSLHADAGGPVTLAIQRNNGATETVELTSHMDDDAARGGTTLGAEVREDKIERTYR
jgi:hypothetical protein